MFHLECLGLSEEVEQNLTRSKKQKYVCSTCKQTNKSKKNDSELSSSTIADLTRLLEEIRSENTYFKKDMIVKLQDFQKSIEFNSDMVEKAIASNNKLHEELKEIKHQNAELLKENKSLKLEIIEMKNEIVDLKQYSRRLNIEISNLPEIQNESIENVIDTVMEKLEVNLKSDITAVHRVPTTKLGKIKPIILQFNTANKKNTFLQAAKVKRLNASDVNSNFEKMPIYINDHLCSELKKLLFECKKYKKENNYKYCWCKGGKIFLRYMDGTKVYRIKCLSDLNNVGK